MAGPARRPPTRAPSGGGEALVRPHASVMVGLVFALRRARFFSTIVKALDLVASQDIVQVALTAKERQRQSEARGH